MAHQESSTRPLEGIRVCMLINNDIVRDGRVLKKARTLCSAGARVLVIGQGYKDVTELKKEPFESKILLYPSLHPYKQPRLGHEDVFWPIRVITNLTYSRLKILYVKARNFRIPRRNLFYNKKMLKPARVFEPHIVEANDVFTGKAALRIAKKTRSLLVYDSHEYFHQYFIGHNDDELMQQQSDEIEKSLFESVSLVITPSEAISEAIKKPHPSVPTITLLNSLPFEASTVSLVHSPVRLLDQTSVRAINGHEQVIEAMQLLEGKATYTIQGQCRNDSYREALECLIARLDLAGTVFLEREYTPDESIGLASQFDIGILSYPFDVPSKNLTLANRVFTYLNAGLAIAACGSKAHQDLEGFSEYGTILDITSPQSIADSLMILIENRELLSKKKHASYQWAPSFSWELQAQKYVAAYTELVSAQEDRSITDE